MWYWPLIISIYTFDTFNRIGRLFLNMVSMPYVGLTSFLQHRIQSVLHRRSTVSMPYVGLTSFLRLAGSDTGSYRAGKCQCPMSGSHHFYCLIESVTSLDGGLCVNALCRAHIISTVEKEIGKKGLVRVNALCRAHIISTLRCRKQKRSGLRRCQCPMSGSHHFYWG